MRRLFEACKRVPEPRSHKEAHAPMEILDSDREKDSDIEILNLNVIAVAIVS